MRHVPAIVRRWLVRRHYITTNHPKSSANGYGANLVIAEMLQIVRASGLREVFNDFVTWAWRVLGPPDIELDEKELDAQWKDQSMTTAREAVLQWYAEIKTDAKAEGKLEGKIEGEVAALQKSLLSLLQVKGLPITEEETAKITACTDPNTLLKWQARIFQANTVAELLAE